MLTSSFSQRFIISFVYMCVYPAVELGNNLMPQVLLSTTLTLFAEKILKKPKNMIDVNLCF
jgi:hypothetical protein